MKIKSHGTSPTKQQKKNSIKKILIALIFLFAVICILDTISAEWKQHQTAWSLILVNNKSHLPNHCSISLMTLKNGEKVDERIYPFLQEMFDAARCDGVYPLVTSAYRTEEEQRKLLTDKKEAFIAEGDSPKEAETKAEERVALPGESEHQTGLAMDINAENDLCSNEDVYAWLNENSYQYGFILRYPPGKTDFTGIVYEPWHYRYVGKKAAKEMFEKNLCLEEYLAKRSHFSFPWAE